MILTFSLECKGVSEIEFTISGWLVSPHHQAVKIFWKSHDIVPKIATRRKRHGNLGMINHHR